MTLGEQREQEAEKASRALPEMVEELRAGATPVEITRHVTEKYEVDARKAAQWVQFVSEKFEQQRRRIAIVGTAFIWLGTFGVVLGVVLPLVGVTVPSLLPGALPGYAVLAVLGAILLAAGLWLGFYAPRLAKVTEDTLMS